MSGVAGGQGCQDRGLWPGLVSAFVVGGDRADTFSTCGGRWWSPAAGGIRCQGPTPGEADRKHQKAGSSKASLPVLPVPRTARGLTNVPCPGARLGQGWWATGTGLHRSRPALGLQGIVVASAAGGTGAVSAAVGGHRARRLLFILVKMRARSCRAGGPAAHDPGSMGLKLEGGRRAAHSSTLHHAGSTAPPGQSPPLPGSPAGPLRPPRGLGVTLGHGSCPWPRATGVGQDSAGKVAPELPRVAPVIAGEKTNPTSRARGSRRAGSRHHAADPRPPGLRALPGSANLLPPLSRRQKWWQQEE